VRLQNFQRDGPVVLEIPGTIDRRHTSPPDFIGEVISPGESPVEKLKVVCHRSRFGFERYSMRLHLRPFHRESLAWQFG
jgi:hypothetical protein